MSTQDREALLAESLAASLKREQELREQYEELKTKSTRVFVIECQGRLTKEQVAMLSEVAGKYLPGEVLLMDDGMKLHELTGSIEGVELARQATEIAKAALGFAIVLGLVAVGLGIKLVVG